MQWIGSKHDNILLSHNKECSFTFGYMKIWNVLRMKKAEGLEKRGQYASTIVPCREHPTLYLACGLGSWRVISGLHQSLYSLPTELGTQVHAYSSLVWNTMKSGSTNGNTSKESITAHKWWEHTRRKSYCSQMMGTQVKVLKNINSTNRYFWELCFNYIINQPNPQH